MKKLNIGFIGCGGIARTHANALRSDERINFVAFCDIVPEKAKHFASTYGGKPYTDYREMLEKEKLDAVFICLPPFAHKDEVMLAAEKGIHIFIEKPIALDIKLAREMVRAVEKAGVKSQVGYQLRFAAGIERAKKLIEKGEVGQIGLVLGEYLCRFIRKDWWIDKSKSGGQIVEQATHLYDAIRWLCGDVERVYGEMNRVFYTDIPNMTIEDVSSVVLRFKSGAVGAIVASIGAVRDQWWFRWKIVGWHATLESKDPHSLRVYWSTKEHLVIEEYSEIGRDPIKLEHNDFINAILYDKETRTPISEGAKTLELTLAAMKAMETHTVISLPLE